MPNIQLRVNIPLSLNRPSINSGSYYQVTREQAQNYCQALIDEIRNAEADLTDYAVKSVVLEGGSLSAVAPGDLHDILLAFNSVCDLKNASGAVEMLPQNFNPAFLTELRNFGFTEYRLVFETLNSEDLQVLRCPYSLVMCFQVKDLLEYYPNSPIVISLLYGIPGQSNASLQNSLNRLLEFNPIGVVLRPFRAGKDLLTVENLHADADCWKGKRPLNDRQYQELYLQATEFLLSNGYLQTAIDAFALPGKESARTIYELSDGEIMGFGVGAVTYMEGVLCRTTAELGTYIQHPTDMNAIAKHLARFTDRDRMGWYAGRAIKASTGISLAAFQQRFGCDLLDTFPQAIASLC